MAQLPNDADLRGTYDDHFYDELASDVRTSADAVVPIIVDLLRPQSVLDVGCGRGTWLASFVRNGVTDISGVDGPHVSPQDLEIDPSQFVACDLREALTLGRSFELAISLEVAEHLPLAVADAFVESLVRHAPAVLFSAAVPGQGGAGHVNEQWQSAWAARFNSRGYAALDVLRPSIWSDARVAYWYAQNAILYVDPTRYPRLQAKDDFILDVVHPRLYERVRGERSAPDPASLKSLLRQLPSATARAARNRLHGAH
jgi:SAM-dependent methyltransferase